MRQLPEKLGEKLCVWYDAGHRELPWRQDREPYHVWLSEIMLQQTRVEAVKGYYARFLSELPTIKALSDCPPDRLTKLWEGLGYYSRVRNLQKAAKVIMEEFGGEFPGTYEAVRALPGVGDYTAGAICSICFALPTPAVDGNVLRVLSRVMEDGAPVTNQKTKTRTRRQKLLTARRSCPFMRRDRAERSRRRSWSSARWCAGRTVLPNAKAAPCRACALQTRMARGKNTP